LAKEVRQIIQPDGTCLHFVQNFEQFNENIREKGSIVFVDVSGPCHDLDFGGFALFTVSHGASPKQIEKEFAPNYPPPWTWEEGQAMYKHFPDPKPSEIVFNDRFKFAEGIPRILFGDDALFVAFYKDTLSAISILSHPGQELRPRDSTRSKILHIYTKRMETK
jgi:hypothetical protein